MRIVEDALDTIIGGRIKYHLLILFVGLDIEDTPMELSRRTLLSSFLGMAGILSAANVAEAKGKKGKTKGEKSHKDKKERAQDRSGKPDERAGKRQDTVEGRAEKRQSGKKH